jgi:hypothetical protein
VKIHTPERQGDQADTSTDVEVDPGSALMTEDGRIDPDAYRQLIVETDRAERQIADWKIRNKAILEASRRGVFDPVAAAALIDRDAIVYDDHGEPLNVYEQLDLVLEQRPWLTTGNTPGRAATTSDYEKLRLAGIKDRGERAIQEAKSRGDGVVRFKR